MRRALVVGLNKYPSGNELNGCANDAQEIAQRLERHGDGGINFDVRTISGECCRDRLKYEINHCFTEKADVALFYFAGHGMINPFGGHIFATDYSSADISLLEILEVVNNSKCENRVVILDSCFSGTMGNNTCSSDTSTIKHGVTILTACTDEQTASETEKHGVFTELLLAALDGEASDLEGNITPGGIYAYVDRALNSWQQRPVFKTNVTTFLPLRKVKPKIDKKILRNLAIYFKNDDGAYSLKPSYEYTNTPKHVHRVIEPYASDDNTRIMKELQQLERVGLVVPCDAEHMYHAAMESKSCQLTSTGKHYWRLAIKNRI